MGGYASPGALEFEPIPTASVWLALALSFVVHLLLVLLVAEPGAFRERPSPRLLVNLSVPAQTVAPKLPAYTEPVERPAVVEPEHTISEPVVGTSSPVFGRPPVEVVDQNHRAALNLHLPQASSEPQVRVWMTDGPFDPDFADAVVERKEARIREASAGQRRAERSGVSSGDYAHEAASGRAVKTEAGCFVLRNEQSLDNSAQWWGTPCRDARSSVWEQAEVTEAQLHPSLRRR